MCRLDLSALNKENWKKTDFQEAMKSYTCGDVIAAEKDGWFKVFNGNMSKDKFKFQHHTKK